MPGAESEVEMVLICDKDMLGCPSAEVRDIGYGWIHEVEVDSGNIGG